MALEKARRRRPYYYVILPGLDIWRLISGHRFRHPGCGALAEFTHASALAHWIEPSCVGQSYAGLE